MLMLSHLLIRSLTVHVHVQVIGEIIAGILLGPSAFGQIPGFSSTMFPSDSIAFLKLFADIGLIFFMFFLGLEVDVQQMRRSLRQSIPIAVCSIAVPFAVGAVLSLWFYDIDDVSTSFTTFLLFLGTALSFTAFPVLARVLTSARLLASPVGGQALSCAAVDDLLAWITLALALSYSSGGGPLNGLYVALISAGLVLFLVYVIHPLLEIYHEYLLSRDDELNRNFLALLFLLLCLTAWFSEILGIEAFVGSFLFGIIVPKSGTLIDNLAPKIELLIVEFFLPLYFANSGIRTNIGGLNTAKLWGALFLVIAVGSAAKILPVTLIARWTVKLNKDGGLYTGPEATESGAGHHHDGDEENLNNKSMTHVEGVVEKTESPPNGIVNEKAAEEETRAMPWRQCFTLGMLMNTRGLVGLIVLNIGLSAGILGDRVFTIMVLFSLVTTFVTPPSLYFLYERSYHEQRLAQLQEVELVARTKSFRDLHLAADGGLTDEGTFNDNNDGRNGEHGEQHHTPYRSPDVDYHTTYTNGAVSVDSNTSEPELSEAELLAKQLAAFGSVTQADIEAHQLDLARREAQRGLQSRGSGILNRSASARRGGSINQTAPTQLVRKYSSREQDDRVHELPQFPDDHQWHHHPHQQRPSNHLGSLHHQSSTRLLRSPMSMSGHGTEDTELRSLSTRHVIEDARRRDAEERAAIGATYRQRSGTMQSPAPSDYRSRSGTMDYHQTQEDRTFDRQYSSGGGGGGGGGGDDINQTAPAGMKQYRNNHHVHISMTPASRTPVTADTRRQSGIQNHGSNDNMISASAPPPVAASVVHVYPTVPRRPSAAGPVPQPPTFHASVDDSPRVTHDNDDAPTAVHYQHHQSSSISSIEETKEQTTTTKPRGHSTSVHTADGPRIHMDEE